MRRRRWQDRLTKEELSHLRGIHIRTLSAFRKMRQMQEDMRDNDIRLGVSPCIAEPCGMCRVIARKLEYQGG